MDFLEIPKINSALILMNATQSQLKGFVMIHMNAQILLAPMNAFAQLVLFKLQIFKCIFTLCFTTKNLRTDAL